LVSNIPTAAINDSGFQALFNRWGAPSERTRGRLGVTAQEKIRIEQAPGD
jgi:hypothetical protein